MRNHVHQLNITNTYIPNYIFTQTLTYTYHHQCMHLSLNDNQKLPIPPSAFRLRMYFKASSFCVFVADTRLVSQVSMVLLKMMILNISKSLTSPMIVFRAVFVCASLLPDIDPLTSITKMTFFLVTGIPSGEI